MSAAKRHYGMDWLRIGAFGLLILYHIGMVFSPWNFHINRPHPINWVTIPMQAVNAWRLPLLFVVSGYASRAIFAGDARPGHFAWQRTLRLLVPTLAAIILVIPPQPWIELSVKHGYQHGFLHFWEHHYFRFKPISGLMLPTWQHLWFVVYLWVYTLVLALVLAILPQKARAGLAWLADKVLAGPLVLALPIALLLANMAWIFPGAAETHALIDDLPIHRVYFAMFLFGFHLRSSDALWAGIRRWWRTGIALAVISYAIVALIEFSYPGNVKLPLDVWALFSSARMVQSWAAIIGLIGLADRYWNRDHRWRTTLNEAIFPFYIVHQTIIVATAALILRQGLPPLVEFLVIFGATVAGCWLFYLIGRSQRWLRPLIGLRATSPRRKLRPALVTS
ncbi:MAG: acyltransferase family protein [Sphingomonas sp.]